MDASHQDDVHVDDDDDDDVGRVLTGGWRLVIKPALRDSTQSREARPCHPP